MRLRRHRDNPKALAVCLTIRITEADYSSPVCGDPVQLGDPPTAKRLRTLCLIHVGPCIVLFFLVSYASFSNCGQ